MIWQPQCSPSWAKPRGAEHQTTQGCFVLRLGSTYVHLILLLCEETLSTGLHKFARRPTSSPSMGPAHRCDGSFYDGSCLLTTNSQAIRKTIFCQTLILLQRRIRSWSKRPHPQHLSFSFKVYVEKHHCGHYELHVRAWDIARFLLQRDT